MFNKKEGVEDQFHKVVGNSHYEKLWNHLDKRKLRDFGSTKHFFLLSTYKLNYVQPCCGRRKRYIILSNIIYLGYYSNGQTFTNLFDFQLGDYKRVMRNNNDISIFYIIYQVKQDRFQTCFYNGATSFVFA